ncbi:MAG: hypothetical protein QGG42_01895 [Phycisphaerae bacterium]|jgi:hypothetical protein|nr:hypothetical protein [Phycisphaerae bacterium]
MRTKALFTMLLAVSIAFVIGCQGTPENSPKPLPVSQPKIKPVSWQLKIAGEYAGIISNTGEEYPSNTVFKVEAEKISGKYALDVNGMRYSGVLNKFTVVGDRKFKCRWLDEEGREGNLSGTFSSDLSNFKGKWDADDGNGDGDWNGKK